MKVKRNIALSQIDFDKFQKISGWTTGELKLTKKIAGSNWLKQQLTTMTRSVENSWGQFELLNGDLRPDFLVFMNDTLFVIEVKDSGFSSNKVLPWESENAWIQCQNYIKEIETKIEYSIPVVGIILLSNIKSKNDLANQIRIQSAKMYNMDTWFQDDLNNKQFLTLFKETRERLNLTPTTTPDPLCAMSKLIPENFTKEFKKCNSDIPLRVLEQSQIQYALSIAHDGVRILYGAAGSGKTIILIKKAVQLSQIYSHIKELRILVVCYNKPLQNFLNSQLSQYKIEVRTMHSWYRSILQRWDDKEHNKLTIDKSVNNSNSRDYFERIAELVDQGIRKRKKLPQYQAILIDEGQDFDQMWLKHLKYAHTGDEPDLFFVCLDGLQAIHSRKENKFRWKDIGIKAQGRVRYLRKNYRNRSEIAEYAVNKIESAGPEYHDDEVIKEVRISEFDREGGEVITQTWKRSNVNKFLISRIAKYPVSTTIMIVGHRVLKLEEITEININLTKIPGLKGKRVVNCLTNQFLVSPNEQFIPIYTVYRSKGLEADIVFYLSADKSDPKINYVGVTRARDEIYDIYVINNK